MSAPAPRNSLLRWLQAALSLAAFLVCVLVGAHAAADDSSPSDLSSEEPPLDSDAEDDLEPADDDTAVGLPHPHTMLATLPDREASPSFHASSAPDAPFLEREPRPPCFG